jgi:hypothetical protein
MMECRFSVSGQALDRYKEKHHEVKQQEPTVQEKETKKEWYEEAERMMDVIMYVYEKFIFKVFLPGGFLFLFYHLVKAGLI